MFSTRPLICQSTVVNIYSEWPKPLPYQVGYRAYEMGRSSQPERPDGTLRRLQHRRKMLFAQFFHRRGSLGALHSGHLQKEPQLSHQARLRPSRSRPVRVLPASEQRRGSEREQGSSSLRAVLTLTCNERVWCSWPGLHRGEHKLVLGGVWQRMNMPVVLGSTNQCTLGAGAYYQRRYSG